MYIGLNRSEPLTQVNRDRNHLDIALHTAYLVNITKNNSFLIRDR